MSLPSSVRGLRGATEHLSSGRGGAGRVSEECEARRGLLQAWGSLESRRSGSCMLYPGPGETFGQGGGQVPGGASLGL